MSRNHEWECEWCGASLVPGQAHDEDEYGNVYCDGYCASKMEEEQAVETVRGYPQF